MAWLPSSERSPPKRRNTKQGLRGALNTGLGAGQAGYGAAQTAVGGLKGALGGGWDTAGRGVRNLARGAGRGLGGVVQTATAPLAGAGRAYTDQNNLSGFKQFMGWQGKSKPETAADAPEATPSHWGGRHYSTPTGPEIQEPGSARAPAFRRLELIPAVLKGVYQDIGQRDLANPNVKNAQPMSLLSVLANYKQKGHDTIDWRDFSKLCLKSKCDPYKVYQKLAKHGMVGDRQTQQSQPRVHDMPEQEPPIELESEFIGAAWKAFKERSVENPNIPGIRGALNILASLGRIEANNHKSIPWGMFKELCKSQKCDPMKVYKMLTKYGMGADNSARRRA